MGEHHYSATDRLIAQVDQALRTLFGNPTTTGRPDPAAAVEDGTLSTAEQHQSARLIRVDHAGEVCAQALYQGQALTARRPEIRAKMQQACWEENDHLDWCAGRLRALGHRPSLLNPLWYAGSLAIGAAAGLAGDRWSLSFVAETEAQVGHHLDGHLSRLPTQDHKSRAILEQMKRDEARHATVALESGAAPLPAPVRGIMALTSRIMTTTAYWF
ncbi:MAG: demethoxyubiquinone hydroxylase family protein [Chromatiales bacterium 21-64-14]|nr:MAG: demethoxyubiquinone hydroxylase family protein [Chromatiales bacterium 21-64-14]HQU14472.1 2-polyprenyl-3-methyl-6-methoxy-1,4-benzoquinone monooxygenase [Gammaproteobacteria bacterium]